MVGLEILVRVPQENRHEFIQTFKLLSRGGKRAEECMSQALFENLSESNCFIWIEHWNDTRTLESHMETGQFQSLMGAIEILGTLEEMRIARLVVL